MQFYDKLVQH